MPKPKDAKNLLEMLYGAPKPAVSRLDMNFKDVTKRMPELQQAARLYEQGKITREQYYAIVDQLKPVTPYEFIPKPATAEEALAALSKDKVKDFGRTDVLTPGETILSRLDIPAYSKKGTWVTSQHRLKPPADEPKTIYTPTMMLEGETKMLPGTKAARKVAKGEDDKSSFATIRGAYKPGSDEEAVESAMEALRSKDYAQIGYDPERRGHFYDRRTMEPIIGTEEGIIQIGPLVLGKKPIRGNPEDFEYASGGAVGLQGGGTPLDQAKDDLTILPEEDAWDLLKGLDRIYTPKIGEYIADVQSPAELLGRIKDLDPEYVDALTSGLSELISQTQPMGPNSFDSVPKYHGSDPLDKLNRQEIDEAAWQVYENPVLASTFVNVLQNPLAYTMTESAVDQPRDIKAEIWNEEFPKWKEDLLGAPADIQPFSQLTSNAAVTSASPLDYTPGLSDKGLGAGFADPGVVEMIDRFDRNQVSATPELAALDQSIASQESNALNQGLARLMSVDQITGDIDPVQSLRNLQAYDPASFEATLSTLQDVPSLVPQSGLGSLRLGMEQLQGLEGVTPAQVGETANAFASILKQPEIGSQVQDIAQNIRNITENQEPVQPVQEDEDLGGGYTSLTPLVRSNFFDKGQQQYRTGGAVHMQDGGDPTQMFNFNPMAAKAAKQKQMRESTPETPLGALSRGFATGLFGSTEEQVPYTGSIMEGSPQRQQSQANLREIGRNVGALTDIGGMVTPFAKPAAQAITRGATALGRTGLEQVDRAMFGEGPLSSALSMTAPLNINTPVSKLGFYNPIEETATTLQRKQGPGQAFLNEFTKAGISKQRLEDAGLAQKLAATPNVTREEVQAMTKGTMPDVEEVVLSRSVVPPYMKGFADLHMPDLNVNDYRQINQLRKLADERYQKALAENDLDAAEFAMKAEEDINKFSRTHSYGTKPGERLTEFHEYQEPGGKNYREVLLKVPSSEKYDDNFRSSHWSDPNVISHIRMNDRVDADNKNVLFIEELQSDWAQEGRKKGFAGKPLTKDDLVATVNNSADRPYWEVRTKDGHFIANTGLGDKEINAQEAVDEALQLVKTRGDKRIPAGPFVKNTNEWVDLSLKNIIRRAVNEGYDRVAFIDGYKSFLRFPQDAKGESTEAGMRKFYDEIVPGRLKALVGKDNVRTIPGITQQRPLDVSLQGDRYYVVDADTDIAIPDHPGFRSLERAEQYLDELYSKTKSMDQIGFDITPEIREKFSKPIPYKKGGAVRISDNPDTMLLELMNAPKMQAGGAALKAFRDKLLAQYQRSLAKDPRFKQAPGEVTNLAGKSYAQWAAEQQYKHELEDALAKLSGVPEKKMSIQDLPVGSRLVSIIGDRTQADKILRSVNETPLANEVILHGGPRFGQGKLAQGKEDFWASQGQAAQGVQNRIDAAAERAKGKPVIGVYTAMSAKDSDMYAKHFAESLIEQYPFTGMTGKQVDAFNKEFRKKYPQFAGVDNPEFVDQIMANTEMRKAFVNEHLKKKNIEKFNIPDGLATRHAITVPELRDVPTGLAGYSVGEMKPGMALEKGSYLEHPTYNTVIPGRYMGGLEIMHDYRDLFPEATQRMRQTLRNNPKFQGPGARDPESQMFGTFGFQGAEQEVTQKLIDELAAREELIKQLGILPYKKGGKVKKVKISNNPDAMQLELMRKKKHA